MTATGMHTHEPGFIPTDRIIGLAIKMQHALGPGLLEPIYHHCLCWEPQHTARPVASTKPEWRSIVGGRHGLTVAEAVDCSVGYLGACSGVFPPRSR
jgi:hypothetical protein